MNPYPQFCNVKGTPFPNLDADPGQLPLVFSNRGEIMKKRLVPKVSKVPVENEFFKDIDDVEEYFEALTEADKNENIE